MGRHIGLWLVGFMMTVATHAQVAPKAASIEGTWLLVALEMDGKRDTTNKNVNNVSLVFGPDGKYAIKPKGFEFPGTYKVVVTKTPAWLDITVGDRTVVALYELRGDTLRVCESEGPTRPADMAFSQCAKGTIQEYRRQ